MPNSSFQVTEFDRYAAAIGAERYRVTCIRMEEDGNKKTFILDKKDGVTKGFLPDEIRQRMPEMLRIQSRGENIYYTPLSEQKHHILLDDMSGAKLTMFLQDGFTPAVILESSPGNFQCLITIPKLDSPFDKDVGNRLTERTMEGSGSSETAPFLERNVVATAILPLKGSYGMGVTSRLYGRNWHVAAQVAGDDINDPGVTRDTVTTSLRLE